MQDVRELVVHRFEEILVKHVKVGRYQILCIVKGNLQASLSSTQLDSTTGRIVSRRTNDVHHSWTIGFQELIAYNVTIDVVPQILVENSQIDALIVGTGRQVVVHVRANVLQTIQIAHIIRLLEIDLHKSIQWE